MRRHKWNQGVVRNGAALVHSICPVYANRLRNDRFQAAISGLSMKSLFGSTDSNIICFEPLIRMGRSWMSWSRNGGTRQPRSRFFRRLLKQQCRAPRRLVTDKLRSYAPAHREVMPDTIHDTSQYANNRAELSHEPTRQRERTMRGFKSMGQAQRFLAVHGTMKNLFAIPRHLMRAKRYRLFRTEALDMYQQVTCA